MFNITLPTSPVPMDEKEDGFAPGYIRIWIDLPLVWVKAIPDIAYIIGVIANILLAIYLLKYKRYRSPIFALILSMCFADVIMCAISIVWTTRFYQLVFPLSARAKVTSGLMAKICIGVWVFSISNSIPFAVARAAAPFEYEGDVYRMCIWTEDKVSSWVNTVRWRGLYLAIVYVLAQLVTTAAFHIVKHCLVLKAGAIAANSMTNDEQKRETTDSMIVITAYLVTSAPTALWYLVTIPGAHPLIPDTIYKIQWCNSALNPFIYAFAAQTLRRDIRRMLCSGGLGK